MLLPVPVVALVEWLQRYLQSMVPPSVLVLEVSAETGEKAAAIREACGCAKANTVDVSDHVAVKNV